MPWGALSKKNPAFLGLKNQFYLLMWSDNLTNSLNHDPLHLENVGGGVPPCATPFDSFYNYSI